MEDDDEPLLPLHLIVSHILPFAFSTPAQALQLALVCQDFAAALRYPWFWTAYLMGRRDEMRELVKREIPDDVAQREGLLRTLETRFNPEDFFRVLGVESGVRIRATRFAPVLDQDQRLLLLWLKEVASPFFVVVRKN